jgi:S-adenosylmethionine-dependent methyltransferase
MSAPGRGPSTQNATQRRSAARTAVVWEGLRSLLPDRARDGGELRVLDIGGGTGGFAVRVAELGHRVTVVDPSPDALAILDRRSHESAVADRVTGLQGDLATVSDQVDGGSFDVVLCHGVLEVVDDPAAAMDAITGVLRPDGALSLLVSQRHAAVVARAMAGQLDQARELLDADQPGDDQPRDDQPSGADGGAPHRFTAQETTALLTGAGFSDVTLQAVRVFSDLVPSSLVDLEPGAADALVALEHAVAGRPEYLTLAVQIHAIARRS